MWIMNSSASHTVGLRMIGYTVPACRNLAYPVERPSGSRMKEKTHAKSQVERAAEGARVGGEYRSQ